MRLVPIVLIMTTALADDEKRDWFRVRRTPRRSRERRAAHARRLDDKGPQPSFKHGWPVDHPTMPRRGDHPGRPLKSPRPTFDEARDARAAGRRRGERGSRDQGA